MKRKTDKLLAVLLAAMVATTVATSNVFALTESVSNGTFWTVESPQPREEESSSEPSSSSEPESSSTSSDTEPSSSSSSSSIPEPSSSSSDSEPSSSSKPEPSSPSKPEPSSSSKPEPSSSTPAPSSSSNSSSSSSSSAPSYSSSDIDLSSDTYSLLPPNSHTSQVNSYDWNELLSGIGSDGSTVSFNSYIAGNTSKSDGGSGTSWLLIAGIALIVIALGGIGFVVYTQFIRGRKDNSLIEEGLDSESPVSSSAISGDTAPIDLGDDYGDDYEESYSDASAYGSDSSDTNEIFSNSSAVPVSTAPQRPLAPGLNENFAADLFAVRTAAEAADPTSQTEPEAVQMPETESTSEETKNDPPQTDEGFQEAVEEAVPPMEELSEEITVEPEQKPAEPESPKEVADAAGSETFFDTFDEIFSSSKAERTHKTTSEGSDPFDLQFNQSTKKDPSDASPVQNTEEDDFWDKFFRS